MTLSRGAKAHYVEIVRTDPISPFEQLRQAVRDNLTNLGLSALDVVNLRVGGLDAPEPGSIAEPFSVLAEMQQEGLGESWGQISTFNIRDTNPANSMSNV